MIERYQIILAYDGTDFRGSQRLKSTTRNRQAGSRTVQGELESALHELGWQGKSILLAGRTDAGTHASGQVASFDLDWNHTPDELVSALNANLPLEMVVRMARVVSSTFHPRYDAKSRRYGYRLFCQRIRDPLRERYAWRIWPPVVDLTPLAELWPGVQDYAAFGTPPRPGGNTKRTVISASWRQEADEWIFEIQANAFLYRMVRRLVFLQVAVGQGRTTIEALKQSLRRQVEDPVQLPSGLAPACGLTLIDVLYDDLEEKRL